MYKTINEQRNEYKEKLNRAIINIIVETTKKETKEKHKFVKENGYEIYKWAGCWHVKNPKTNKCVCGAYVWKYPKGKIVEITLYELSNRYIDNKDVVKVDIVNYLNKPINQEYRNIKYPRIYKSKAYENYQWLKHLKWEVNYHKELQDKRYNEIVKKLDEIKKIQEEVQKEMEREKEAKIKLEKYKEKIGLRK